MKKLKDVKLDHSYNGKYTLLDALQEHYEKDENDYLYLNCELIYDVDFRDVTCLKRIKFFNSALRNCIFPERIEDCDFFGANLTHSTFRGVTIKRCIFKEACLYNANFVNARIIGCDFQYANVKFTNFTNAIIDKSHFLNARDTNAIFYNTDFIGETPFVPLACPTDGSFTGWKKVNDLIVKLRIPASAKRSSCTSRKCRAEYAKVLGIYDKNKKRLPITLVINRAYDQLTHYEVGRMVYPDAFDENRWEECSNGIHFFINFEDAVRY